MPVRPLTPDDHAAVAAILAARAAADGRPALSEHKAARLFRGSELELVFEGTIVTGYAHAAHHSAARPELAHWAVEVVVDPASRNPSGETIDLIETAGALIAEDGRVTVWAWRAEDVAAADALGLVEIRALYEMHRPLPIEGGVRLPEGVVVRPFRPGRDEGAWLAANNAAFANHPENGALDIENLNLRLRQPWFDPQGFLMAWQGDSLVGSCWTKLHPGAVGEIYIIGVVPGSQGRGLGTALVRAGLEDLAVRQGAGEAMLYVDSADVRAVAFYRSFGFDISFTTREFVVRRGAGPQHGAVADQPNG